MTREDEIMAGYLLKGGKMLSKSCPSCGCPLFEVRGETLCVVCREGETGKNGAEGPVKEARAVAGAAERPGPASPALGDALEETLRVLCIRIREEKDPQQVQILVKSLRTGVEALRMLRQP